MIDPAGVIVFFMVFGVLALAGVHVLTIVFLKLRENGPQVSASQHVTQLDLLAAFFIASLFLLFALPAFIDYKEQLGPPVSVPDLVREQIGLDDEEPENTAAEASEDGIAAPENSTPEEDSTAAPEDGDPAAASEENAEFEGSGEDTKEDTEDGASESEDGFTSNQLYVALFAQLLIHLFIISSLIYLIRARGLTAVEFFGLNRLPLFRAIVTGIGGMILLTPLVMILGAVWNLFFQSVFDAAPKEQDVVEMMRETSTMLDRILMIEFAVIVVPIAEETIFRGYLYPVAKKYVGPVVAAIVVSLIFAVIHGSIAAVFPLFVLALIFTLFYERTGSLIVPILMHAVFNLYNSIMLLAVSHP